MTKVLLNLHDLKSNKYFRAICLGLPQWNAGLLFV